MSCVNCRCQDCRAEDDPFYGPQEAPHLGPPTAVSWFIRKMATSLAAELYAVPEITGPTSISGLNQWITDVNR